MKTWKAWRRESIKNVTVSSDRSSSVDPKKVSVWNGHRKSWMMSKAHENVILKHEIEWIWGPVHAWLAAMDPAQYNWLAQLHTSQATPPRKSSNAHDKSPVTMVLEKHHRKARNHMNAESCGCMVGCNGSGTMQLTSAASTVTYFTAKTGEVCSS